MTKELVPNDMKMLPSKAAAKRVLDSVESDYAGLEKAAKEAGQTVEQTVEAANNTIKYQSYNVFYLAKHKGRLEELYDDRDRLSEEEKALYVKVNAPNFKTFDEIVEWIEPFVLKGKDIKQKQDLAALDRLVEEGKAERVSVAHVQMTDEGFMDLLETLEDAAGAPKGEWEQGQETGSDD